VAFGSPLGGVLFALEGMTMFVSNCGSFIGGLMSRTRRFPRGSNVAIFCDLRHRGCCAAVCRPFWDIEARLVPGQIPNDRHHLEN
jgi:hypothetical protein